MKTKVLSLFALTGALLLTIACASEETTKQEQTQEQDTKGLTTFVVEDNEQITRTTAEYDGSGLNFYWTEGDRLWVNNATLKPDAKNNIADLLAPNPTIPTGVKRTATAKFYFDGNFTAPSYPVRYTGKGSTAGDKVTIKAQQNQAIPNDASHLGESGDCGTATATKSGGKYNFTLDHKAAYLTFMPYNLQGAISGVHIAQIKVTADQAIAGEFTFNDDGIDLTSRPAPSIANKSITLTLNSNFNIPGSAADLSKNGAIMVLAPGIYSTFTVEYTLRDDVTNKTVTITKIYNNLTLTAGKNRRVIADLQVTDYSPWLNYYYQWGATAFYWDGVTLPNVLINYGSYNGTPSTNSNGKYADNDALSSPPFDTAPNANELYYYVHNGDPHWDNNILWAFKGHLYTGGVWLKKQYIIYNDLKTAGYNQLPSQAGMKEKFYSSKDDATGTDYNFESGYTKVTPSTATLSSTADYFFLPALGFFHSSSPYQIGSRGYYWTLSPILDNNTATALSFFSNEVIINNRHREDGFVVRSFE